MARTESVILVLDNQTGPKATLTISCVPSSATKPLWDLRSEITRDLTLQPVRVLEGEEYVYRLETEAVGDVTSDIPDLFMPDYVTGRTGRFRPGLNVGELLVNFWAGGLLLGSVSLEIISSKLHYLSDYRAMLKDIASYVTEIIADRFAPVQQGFVPFIERDALSLYQQFAFVRAFASSPDFKAALQQIMNSPHQSWLQIADESRMDSGIRLTSRTLRSIVTGRRRVPVPAEFDSPISTVPIAIETQRFTQDVDNPENRFVAWMLRYWQQLAAAVREKLQVRSNSAFANRGLREADEVIGVLSSVLSSGMFAALGEVTVPPWGSTVLHSRAGYRDIYRVYLQSQVAAELVWDSAEDLYGAGKKNVALLYEYWSFITLLGVIAELCNAAVPDFRALLQPTPDGLSLLLRRGTRAVVRGVAEVDGRNVTITFFYNRSFPGRRTMGDGSWSREMVPDFSLRLVSNERPDHQAWVHFDAKYRVESTAQLFGPASDGEPKPLGNEVLRHKSDDLMRMHAYKDAVRRSTGAYILFPGTKGERFREFREIVPGIGAFALRPGKLGPEGLPVIRQFLKDVLACFVSAPPG